MGRPAADAAPPGAAELLVPPLPEHGGREAASSILYKAGNTCLGEVCRWAGLPFACCPCCPCVVSIETGYVGLLMQFGVVEKVLDPGLHSINPLTQRVIQICKKVATQRIEMQNAMTADNVSVMMDAVTFFFVSDPVRARFCVEDYLVAVKTLAATTVRVLIGEHTLQQLFVERASLNRRLAQIMQDKTSQWGISIQGVEIRDITIPENMQRAMAQAAEARREAEAKIIVAEAQRRASELYSEAAACMSSEPISVNLQWFETLRAIAQDKNSTIIVPDSFLSLGAALQSVSKPSPAPADATASGRPPPSGTGGASASASPSPQPAARE